jgi:hypothetical protein
MNDYDICNLIEKYGIEDDRVVDSIKAKYFIIDEDWKSILDLYTKENNEFSDTD